MRLLVVRCVLALLMLGAIGQAKADVSEDAASPRLRYTGRWAFWAGAMTTINSGSVIEAQFRGSRCVLRFDMAQITERPQVYVQIDRESPRAYTVRERLLIPVSGEAKRLHRLRLTVKAVEEHQRLWEHLEGAVKFTGIETQEGLETLPPDNRPLVEFVGDSLTAGVLVGTEGSTTERMDGLLAHPTLIGERLNVRVSQVGFGYLGILKDGNGQVPIADKSFPYIFLQIPVAHKPAMVVVNLGTNDSNKEAAQFIPAYRHYLAVVRKTYPAAKIVCVRPFGGAHAGPIRAEVERLRAAGDSHVFSVDTTGWLTVPDDFTDGLHPNTQGHRKAADRLSQALRPLLQEGIRPDRTGR